jgi:hypothetical protein
MDNSQAQDTKRAAADNDGPRLVLITAEEPEGTVAPAPNEIIGTEPRIVGSGGFCLTDR